MDRRGFLHSLMAVTAAIASGVQLPSSKQLSVATPKQLNTSLAMLNLLNECVPLSISAHASIDNPMTYEVEYLHCPGRKLNADALLVDSYTKNLRPISVSFSQAVGELTRLTVEWA